MALNNKKSGFKENKEYPKKDDIKVATMTLISKINCNIDIQKIIDNVKLENGKVEKIKFGSKKKSVEELKLTQDDNKRKNRKNKKKKKNFYNQVTIIIKPFIERKNGVNMKLSENGSVQMTGTTSIQEGKDTIYKMIEIVSEWNNEIFYRKTKENIDDLESETTTSSVEKVFLSSDEREKIEILFVNCELIIVSFEIPYFIHLKKFDEILKTKYNLLSILGTSSYPGINTKITYELDCCEKEHIKKKKKYTCNCRDMSIFTFRTGKVIITGFQSIEKIKVIFERYIDILKKEEENIKIINPLMTGVKNKIMKVNGKTFEVVDEF